MEPGNMSGINLITILSLKVEIEDTKKASNEFDAFFVFVNRIGFEPMTYSLEGYCSIQLSYQSILFV